MRDSVSVLRANILHPFIRQEVIDTITATENDKFPANIAIRIVQGLRTFPEQQALYNLGRTVKNPDGYDIKKRPLGNRVTMSQTGQSYHNYGLAIDFALLIDGKLSWDISQDNDRDGEADWLEVVESFEALQYTWGGHFSKLVDDPHLEKHKGIHWTILLQRYNAKDFIPGTSFVRI